MSASTHQTVVVLGVSGLIGRTVAKNMRRRGYTVRGASRGPGEFQTNAAMSSELLGIELRFGDLTDRSFAREVVEGANVVICAAGISGVAASIENPAAAAHGTFDLWSSVVSEVPPESRVILMSSQLVYGPSAGRPFSETDRLHPVSPYAENLARIEADGSARAQRGEIQFVALRLTNVFGDVLWLEKPRSHGLVAIMLRDLLLRGEISLFGGGDQTVNLLHVDDLSSAILEVVAMKLTRPEDTLNIRGTRCTVRSVAEALCRGARTGRLVDRPWPPGLERAAATNIELNDARFRRRCDWEPTRTGIEEVEEVARVAANVLRT